MSVNNWSEIGSQIREAVETSLNTGDFQQLGDVISGTVDSAVSEVKYQFDQVRQMWNNGGQAVPPANQGNVPPQGRWGTQQQGPGNVPPYNQGNVPPQNRWGTQQQNQGGVPPQNQGYAPPTGQWSVPKRPRVARVRMNPVGKVSGILFIWRNWDRPYGACLDLPHDNGRVWRRRGGFIHNDSGSPVVCRVHLHGRPWLCEKGEMETGAALRGAVRQQPLHQY